MAYQRHTHVPGGIYLVSVIGEHDQSIFVDDSDRAALGELVGHVVTRCAAQVHAFNWLEGELLMVIQVNAVSPSGVIQRIASAHARRVNEKLGYKGNLFQHPHRAILLHDPATVLETVAAIHRNPYSTWSSHRAYLGLEEIPWLTRQTILNLLSNMPSEQPTAYAAMMQREEAWKSLRSPLSEDCRTRVCRPSDQLLAWLKLRSSERAKPASLDQLIGAVAQWLQVDAAMLESNANSRLLSLARALIVWSAMQNGIASLSELSRRFGRGRSTLHETRDAYRIRVPNLFNIPLADILRGPAIGLSEVLRLIDASADISSQPQKRNQHFE
jgi:putative transposase